MTTPYTPVPTRLADLTQLLLDSDPQRAATYNAILQELIDAVAYLQSNTTDLVGYPESVMQNISTAVSGATRFQLIGVGIFTYYSSANHSLTIPKYHYPATGMGTGAWVNDVWLTMLGSSTNAKLVDSLLPYTQLIAFAAATKSTYVNQLVNNSTFATTADHADSDLSLTIGSVQSSDKFEMSVGPLEIFAYEADQVQLRVRIRQNDSGDSPVDTNYLRLVAGPTGGITVPVEFPIYYQSISDNDITVVVEHKNLGSLNSSIDSPAQPSTAWGASGFQWLRYKQYRVT